MREAARTLDLEAVVDHQDQHSERHAERAVQVSRGHCAVVRHVQAEGAQEMIDARHPIHRDQVDRVHQRDPDENHQGQRSDPGAIAVDDALGLVVDHLDNQLNEGLKTTGNARGDTARGHAQEDDADQAHQHGPEHRVPVDDGEVDDGRLLATDAIEILQMLRDIRGRRESVLGGVAGGFCDFSCHDDSVQYCETFFVIRSSSRPMLNRFPWRSRTARGLNAPPYSCGVSAQ